MRLGDEAASELQATSEGQFVLTEVLMLETVDRLIMKRLALRPYRRWREQFRKLRRRSARRCTGDWTEAVRSRGCCRGSSLTTSRSWSARRRAGRPICSRRTMRRSPSWPPTWAASSGWSRGWRRRRSRACSMVRRPGGACLPVSSTPLEQVDIVVLDPNTSRLQARFASRADRRPPAAQPAGGARDPRWEPGSRPTRSAGCTTAGTSRRSRCAGSAPHPLASPRDCCWPSPGVPDAAVRRWPRLSDTCRGSRDASVNITHSIT